MLHLDKSLIDRLSMVKSLDSRPGKITGEQYVKWGRTQALRKVKMEEVGVPTDLRRFRAKDNLRI